MILFLAIIAVLSVMVWFFLFIALAYPLNKRLDPLFKKVPYLPEEDVEGYWFEPSIIIIPKYFARAGFYIASAAFGKYRILNCKPMKVRSHLPGELACACDVAATAGLISLVYIVIRCTFFLIDFFRVHWFKIEPIWGQLKF